MLKSARFVNFKSLAAVDVPLQPLTLLVGPNGAGKTSVLEGLHVVARASARNRQGQTEHGVVQAALGQHLAPERALTRGADARTGMELHVTADDGSFVRVTARPGAADPAQWDLARHAPDASMFTRDDVMRTGAARVVDAVRLKLDAEVAARPSPPRGEMPSMEPNGAGLAAVLQYLAGERPEALEAVRAALDQVIAPGGGGGGGPFVEGIRVSPKELDAVLDVPVSVDGVQHPASVRRKETGSQFALQLRGQGRVPADLLSEGTVLCLALLVALHARPQPPSLVLLDDLDAALHPSALAPLLDAIRAVQRLHPGLQVVATTHSPYLLDLVEAEQVVVLRLDAQGHTVARSLADHPEWHTRFKGKLRPGEFWGSFGESWL